MTCYNTCAYPGCCKRIPYEIKQKQPIPKYCPEHDLHYKHREWWYPFLKEMLENGNNLLIVSKPEFAAIEFIDHNLFKYRDQIEFRFSIGTNDETTRQFWEPNAPSISERIKCLNYVYEGGYLDLPAIAREACGDGAYVHAEKGMEP